MNGKRKDDRQVLKGYITVLPSEEMMGSTLNEGASFGPPGLRVRLNRAL